MRAIPFVDYSLVDSNRVTAEWLNAVDAGVGGVSSLASLALLATSAGSGLVWTTGYFIPGDGGGGMFRWDAASVEADNGGTIIAPAVGGTGRWKRVTNGSAKNVNWFGFLMGRTGAENVTAWGRVKATIQHNDAVYFPATPGTWYEVNDTLLIPSKTGVSYFGDGKQATRIRLVGGGATTDVFAREDTSQLSANNLNDISFHDLGLEATGSSRHGINWLSMSRSSCYSMGFNGLGWAAIKMQSSLHVSSWDVHVTGCGYGLWQDTTGWSGLNGLDLDDWYISSCSQRGVDIAVGAAKFRISATIESCLLGGISLGQDCIDGDIFIYEEENDTPSSNTEGVYIGRTSFCSNIRVWGYWNGTGVADDFYYPIRAKYASYCTVMPSTLTVGSKFISFEASGSLSDNTIHAPRFIGGAYSSPNEAQPTYKFGASVLQSFVNARNKIIDPLNAPLIQHNALTRRTPYGWTQVTAGGSAIAKSATNVMNLYGTRMTRGTGACEMSLTFAVPAEFRDNFAVLELPLLAVVSNKQITIVIAPNGTGAVTSSLSDSNLVTGLLGMEKVAVFFPSDCTSADLVITLNADAGDFHTGHPCLHQGLESWYGTDGVDPWWKHTGKPTTGTWSDGDAVKFTDAVAGSPPGAVCTTAGAAGTFVFKNEAALEA